jgi:pseudouridine kinase
LNGATYKAETTLTAGGVARNIAEDLYKLNGAVSLISAFGNDQNGKILRQTLPAYATACSITCDYKPTASCAIILDSSGVSRLCAGDMNIHQEITPEMVNMYIILFIYFFVEFCRL